MVGKFNFLPIVGRSKRGEIYHQSELKKLFVPQNKQIDSSLIGHAVHAVESQAGQTIFDLSGVEKSNKTTLSLIANVSRTYLQADMPSVLDHTLDPQWYEMRNYVGVGIGMQEHELNILLDGHTTESKERQTVDIHSLGRHLLRSSILSRVYIEAMLEKHGIPFGDTPEIVEAPPDPRLRQFGETHLGGLHPFHHPVVMRHHDYVRRIDQKSSHDLLIKPLVEEIGLIPTLKKSFHEPVPCDGPLPDHFDNGAQMISRLADSFGKVEWIEGHGYRLRRTINSMSNYSRERQEIYFAAEKDMPGTYWYGRDRSNLEIYLTNERIAYTHAANWFEKMSGKIFEDFMASVDNYPTNFEIYTR